MPELGAPGVYPWLPLGIIAFVVAVLLVLLRRWGLLTLPS
jgi:hypothetical protein